MPKSCKLQIQKLKGSKRKSHKAQRQKYEFSFLHLLPYKFIQVFSFHFPLQACSHIKSFCSFDFEWKNCFLHFHPTPSKLMDLASWLDYFPNCPHLLKFNTFGDKLYHNPQTLNLNSHYFTYASLLLLSNFCFFVLLNYHLYFDLHYIQLFSAMIFYSIFQNRNQRICINMVYDLINFVFTLMKISFPLYSQSKIYDCLFISISININYYIFLSKIIY